MLQIRRVSMGDGRKWEQLVKLGLTVWLSLIDGHPGWWGCIGVCISLLELK